MSSGSFNDFTYIDFGMSFGSNIWGFIDYSTNPSGELDEKKMGAYLYSLFAQMKGAGQNAINLAFAQLDNLDAYQSGNFTADAGQDVVMALLNQLQSNHIAIPGYSDFLSYFVDQAHQNGIKVNLALGGADAGDKEFKILQQVGETYVGRADELYEVMQKYGFDNVDFDIEDPTFLNQQVDGQGKGVVDFFKELHSKLEPSGKTVTLTVPLGQEWRTNLGPLLGSNFPKCFDGLNLMGYSDTQYWLDPDTPPGESDPGWTIEDWIQAIGPENAGCIHLGFDDGVAYAQPSADGGQCSFSIQPGSSNGQAAAQIFYKFSQSSKKMAILLWESPFSGPQPASGQMGRAAMPLPQVAEPTSSLRICKTFTTGSKRINEAQLPIALRPSLLAWRSP